MQAFYFLIGFVLLTSLIRNKKIGSLLLFVYLWILFAFSYGNADYFNYELQYQMYGSNYIFDTIQNTGFKFICKMANNAGLDYQTFLIVEATVILTILFFVIIKYSDNPWGVTVLFIIYSFPIDTVQVRNFLGRAIVLLGVVIFLSVKPKLIKYTGMVACILMGAMVHVSLFAYLLFLLIPFLEGKYLKFWIIGIVFLEFLMFRNFHSIALLVTSNSNVNEYISKSVSVGYVIFVILYMFVNYMISYLCYRISQEKSIEYLKRSSFIDFAFRINTLLLVFVPMACVANDFFRLFRISIFLNYIVVSDIHQSVGCSRDGSPPINVISLCKIGIVAMAILSNYMFISSSYMDTVVKPLFENNLFIP
jgi:hypothetical protein